MLYDDDMSSISTSKFSQALESLKKGYRSDPSEIERDGIIQRFEYTLELAWKTSKRVLEQHSITSDSPKNVFRDLGKAGWISNVELWMEFLEARNLTSHIYNKDVADRVFASVAPFIREASALLATLDTKAK